MDKKEIIKEIINGIKNFKIIPFFGAGMSKPCKAMDWSEIINFLKEELKTTTNDKLLVAQEYENKFGRDVLISKLREFCELKIIDSTSLENHMKILAMNPPLIYTTNYDCAIEEASELLLRKYKKIIGLKDIVESSHGERQIIKFHGDFANNDSIVFTRNDYDNRLNIEKHPLDVLFRSHILGKSVLFLGYGFGDENINYIFNKHKELYGTDNLPKSYIISFEHDEQKEEELKSKNVITLELSSVDELRVLISDINSDVFKSSVDTQFEDMFKPLPSIVLSSFELKNLQDYVNSDSYTPKEKYNKIRETLEVKTIPQDIENDLCNFFESIIIEDYHEDIKEAILISFQHTNFRQIPNVIKLCMDLLRLSENPKFILDFDNNSWGSDVIMIIEHKLSQILQDSKEVRKWGCLIILSYLEGMMAEKKNLSFKQVDRLLDGLKNFGYNEFGDLGAGFNPEHINSVIEHYLSQHDSTLRARFQNKSILGKRRQTAMEIMEEMMKSLPKNLK